MYYKFLKFVCLIMQIRHYLIKYAQFCISVHMIKPGAKFIFHFLYTQDEKINFRRISGYMLFIGNQNILFIPLKNRFSPYILIKMSHKSGQD